MKYIKAVNKSNVTWLVLGAVVILGAVLAGALTVLWKEHWKPAQKTAPVAAAPVIVGPDVSLQGKIFARNITEVPAPVEGKVDVFHADIGQEIFEGQLLAQINNETLTAEEEHAAELAERARTRVNDLESALIAARLEASRARAVASRLKSESDRSDKAYQRQKTLLSAGATPRLAFEKAEKEFQTNQAEAANAESVAEQAERRAEVLLRDQDAAKKSLEDSDAELERVKEDLANSEVHAPVDGLIVGRRGNAGDEVNRNMKDLFQIATDLTQLSVVVEPPPPALARIRPGQAAVVTITEAQNEPIACEVKKVENGQVTIEFVSPNPLIKPGLTAQVRIKLT